MPSPQGSPRRGRPSSAAGTPPRSPSGREPRTGSAETSDGTNASRGASSSRPRVDTRSPATRATLAATPVADLVASPLAPLAFDLKKLASQAPARAKDGAIVALSAQLDAMRARLREAEQAAGSPAPVSSTPPSADIDDAARAHDVESSVLVALIAAVDARAEEIGETLASTSGSSRDNFADTVAAFEEALDELRDECVCDGLAKLSTTTLEKIVRVVDSIRGGDWLDVDPVPAAVLARERVAGYDDDVKIFIEATKEATTALARRAHDALRDVWPRDAPTLLDVADASFEQLARDERACVDVTRRTLRQLAWVIAASSK